MNRQIIFNSTGFLAIIILMIAALLFGLTQMERVYSRLYSQSSDHNKVTRIVMDMRNAIMIRALIVRNMMITEDVFEIDQERLRLYHQGARINRGIDALNQRKLPHTQFAILMEFLDTASQGTPLLNEIIDKRINGQSVAAMRAQIEKALNLQEYAVNKLDELSHALQSSNNQIIEDTLKHHRQAANYTSIFLLAATLIAIITAVFVVRRGHYQHKLIADEKEKFSALFSSSMNAIALISGDFVTECNQPFRELFHLDGKPLPLSITEFFPAKRAEDSSLYKQWRHFSDQPNLNTGKRFDWLFKREDNSTFDADVSLSIIPLSSGNIIQAVIRDVTTQKQYERKMHYQATHDPLTDIYNRCEFYKQLDTVLDSCKTMESNYSLCYIDLDKFKEVNDTVGHAAGDKLLIHIVNILKDNIRSSDILARLGGDEFALLLENCEREKAEQITEAICKKIEAFRFSWESKIFQVTLSIGITTFNDAHSTPDEIINSADLACYKAKNNGRNQVYVEQ